jgi:hypothetical protein
MRVAHIVDGVVVRISMRNQADGVNFICVDGCWCDEGAILQPDGSFKPKQLTLDEILELRKAAYPPLSELADAMYWASHGDSSKMDAYLAAVEQVKLQYPKPQA